MTALVPEFAVSDIKQSLEFYVSVLGFEIKYQRPEEGFAYLNIGAAELMLDQLNLGRDFNIDEKPPAHPFGRGLNVQIKVDDLAPMLNAIKTGGLKLYLPLEEKYYRKDDVEIGQSQFVIADPDGYLLRFCQFLGTRPVSK
ncbi:MAG: VOC family protein [Alphaproteobacteria bacterium]|nr:VOC family protein [Alphaproteobacteria bacterium]